MSRNKAKGTSYETATVNWLREKNFQHVYRPALTGAGDTGDVNGIVNVAADISPRQAIIQCKNAKTFKLSEWLNGAVDQAIVKEKVTGNPTLPILSVKRPGKGLAQMDEQYAVMRMKDVVQLLREAGYR